MRLGGGAPDWPHKVWALLAAIVELSDEHELDTVLPSIVAGVAAIADARYAALGIYDSTGTIESFIHHGIDDGTIARIARFPQGHGLLGEVMVASGPIRLADLSADPRFGGFPLNHPPMRTFLGVPVARGGHRYGNLYLAEKAGGVPFDEEDEAVVVAFAACAVGAIESARLVHAERARAEAVAELAASKERVAVKRDMLGAILNAQEPHAKTVAGGLADLHPHHVAMWTHHHRRHRRPLRVGPRLAEWPAQPSHAGPPPRCPRRAPAGQGRAQQRRQCSLGGGFTTGMH